MSPPRRRAPPSLGHAAAVALASLAALFASGCTVLLPHSLITSSRPLAAEYTVGQRLRGEQCYSDFFGFPTSDVDLSIDAAMKSLEARAPTAAAFVDIRIDAMHGWNFWPISAFHCTRVSARPATLVSQGTGAPRPSVGRPAPREPSVAPDDAFEAAERPAPTN